MEPIPEPIAVEARAKLMWGESTAKVLTFLESKQIGRPAAESLVERVLGERAEAIRREGWGQIWRGAGLVALPAGYYFLTLAMGYILLKLMAALIVAGVVGIVLLTKGISKVARPRAVTGDLSKLNG